MAIFRFLFLLTWIPLISCRQINFLTLDEVEAHLKNEDNSDYEIVPLVHTLHKENVSPTVRIRAFQEDIELYLEPNENYLFGASTPIYLSSKSVLKNIVYKRISHNVSFTLYHDKANGAALVVEKDEDSHNIYGLIGDHMIRPLSKSLHSAVRTRRSTKPENVLVARDDEIYSNDHILIKLKNTSNKKKPVWENKIIGGFDWGDLDFPNFNDIQQENQPQRVIPEKIYSPRENRLYPEILVAADNSYFKLFKSDISEFVRYQAVFWNGVDLLYRYFQNPEIRLNIAGIVISQDSSADYYSDAVSDDLVFFEGALESLTDAFTKDTTFPKDSYDFVVALTSYRLTDGTFDPSKIMAGVAYTRGACSRQRIGLVNDIANFHGITTATHEIGHLLGAIHDFETECQSYVTKADYIMSYDSNTQNLVRWSSCSLAYMDDFFRSDESKCLRNQPRAITNPYPKFLPGSILSVNEQCNLRWPGSNVAENVNNISVCRALVCAITTEERVGNRIFKKTQLLAESGGAVEGSRCENGGICLQGDCVPIPRNYHF